MLLEACMELKQARDAVHDAVHRKDLVVLVADCAVEYWGRAASKLQRGKRLVVIKGDGSIAIHQNRHVRPTNYMLAPTLSVELAEKEGETFLLLKAVKAKPKETLNIEVYGVEFLHAAEMTESHDLRLFGSEKELSNSLMESLDFIEAGLKPMKQESPLRKGVIDILAEDSKGRLVVIEVKRRTADFEAVTQLERYMKEVHKMKNRETRGILVAPDIRKHAMELLGSTGLEFFKLDFEIGNPHAKIKGLESRQMKLTDGKH